MKKLFAIAASTFLIAGCGVELGFPDGAATGGSSGQKGTGKIIYITTGTYNGLEVGGTAGADGICNGNERPNSSSYQALIYSSGTNGVARQPTSGWPLRANQQYIRADGTIIGTVDANRQMQFSRSVGTAVGNVWTGLGSGYSAGQNCGDWTDDGRNSMSAQVGGANVTGLNAFSTGTAGCAQKLPLFCVEQ